LGHVFVVHVFTHYCSEAEICKLAYEMINHVVMITQSPLFPVLLSQANCLAAVGMVPRRYLETIRTLKIPHNQFRDAMRKAQK
jgi:hypothetical protein